MATSSSEGTGEEREAVGWLCNVRDCFDCIELKNSDDKVECLWVKMRGKANKAGILLRVCYREPSHCPKLWRGRNTNSPVLYSFAAFFFLTPCRSSQLSTRGLKAED